MKSAASATKSMGWAVLIAMFLLAAAVDADAAQTLREIRDKWIGRSAAALIDQHGYPDTVNDTDSGNKIFAYSKTKRRMYSVPIYIPPVTHELDIYRPADGVYSYGTSTTQGTWAFEYRTREATCTGYFEIGPDSTIVGVRFKGEECPK